MALMIGELAQNDPAAATLTPLYVCPALKRTSGRLTVANRGAATTFRVALAVAGAADAVEQYKAWDMALDANDTLEAGPIGLKATDVLRVQSASGNVTFTLNGIEEDA